MLGAELSLSIVVLSVTSLSDSTGFMRAPSMSSVELGAELSSVVGFSISSVMWSVNSSFAGVACLLFVCLNCQFSKLVLYTLFHKYSHHIQPRYFLPWLQSSEHFLTFLHYPGFLFNFFFFFSFYIYSNKIWVVNHCLFGHRH